MGFFACGGVSGCQGKGQMWVSFVWIFASIVLWVSVHGGGGVGCCCGGVSDGFFHGSGGGGGILVAELVVIGS